MTDEPLLRRVAAQNLHLTLAFLGEINPAEADSAAAAIRIAAADLVPFGLRIEGELAAIGARRRVLAAAVRGDIEELIAVWTRLREALAESGFQATERRFLPHLTLARARPQATARQRRAIWRAAESQLESLQVEFQVRDIGLYQSRLGPSGASYRLLARAEFGKSRSDRFRRPAAGSPRR